MCVVVLPIGLSYLGVSKSYHSMRDTRWAFCYSRGRGVGMLKMADFSIDVLAHLDDPLDKAPIDGVK